MQYDGKLYDVSYLKRVKVVVKLTRSGFNKQKEYHNRQRRVVVAPEQTLICLQCGNDNLRKRQKVQTTWLNIQLLNYTQLITIVYKHDIRDSCKHKNLFHIWNNAVGNQSVGDVSQVVMRMTKSRQCDQ